jgi:hypothetical protein
MLIFNLHQLLLASLLLLLLLLLLLSLPTNSLAVRRAPQLACVACNVRIQ